MMKKIVYFLAILMIAVLVFSASPARLVQADDPVLCTTDCYVAPTGNDANLGNEDSPFKTIQKGIDTVSEGGTVHVAAGTYQESKYSWADLVIDKSLTLIGQGRANSVVQFSENGMQGLEINAGGGTLGPVRIEAMGFTRRPSNTWSANWAVRIGLGGGTFEKIEWVDNKIDYAKTRGLHFESAGTYKDVLLQNSGFLNNGVIGVSFQGVTEKLTINGGNFNFNGVLDPFHGYGLAFEGDVSNISVTGANFNSNTAQGINAARISNAVFDGINANDNRSTDVPYYQQYGFALNDWVYGSENILIKNSSFARNGWAGLLISAPDINDQGHFIKNVEVVSSKFIGNEQAGISVWDVKDLQNLKIHHNRFWSVQALLGNQSVVVDAENNWYGYNTGPGASYSKVTGNFDANPWLVTRLEADPAFTPGGVSTITADLTFNSDDADTSSLGFLYPGQVSFTPVDKVSPASATLTNSKASSTFTAPNSVPGDLPFDVCGIMENSIDKGCLTFTPPTVCTTDCYVAPTGSDADFGNEDSPFKTIQKGIDTVSAGGTVHVAEGIYQESKYGWADLVIDKSLTLLGQGRAKSVVQFSDNGMQGLEINAGGGTLGPVRIEAMGFTRRPGHDWSTGWAVRIGLGGGTFEKIEWVDNKIDYAQTRAMHFESAGIYQEVLLQNSGFIDNGTYGVSFQGKTEKLTINGGNFSYNGAFDPGHGYGLAFEGDVSNITITGATFRSNARQGINATNIKHVVFDGITVADNGTPGDPTNYGFALYEWTGGSEDILIKNSSFARNGWAGILISNPDPDFYVKDIEIQSSAFIGNHDAGISVWDVNDLQNLKIHHNRFWSTNALLGNLSTTVDAENNWFGYNTGPGATYSKVVGNFDADPWLVMKLDVNPVFLPGQDSTITADLTFNSDDADTSSLGFLFPGQVSFTPTEYFNPDTEPLVNSEASSVFTAPPIILGGVPFDVCAQLENSWDKVCVTFPNFSIVLPIIHKSP